MNLKKVKMEDRISNLPDEILCHILSFLPTKEAVVTSVLSKRWKSLWRSVSTINFDDANFHGSKWLDDRFVETVNSVILSRDSHLPIQKLRLFVSQHLNIFTDITVLVDAAVQRRVEHIDISLALYGFWLPFKSSSIFSCTTLVVLKLKGLNLKQFSSVIDLPSLKVLHLHVLRLPDSGCLAEFLNGCPVLEDLKVRDIEFRKYETTDLEFKTLTKLVRAEISGRVRDFLMNVVKNVQFLRTNEMYIRLPHDHCVTGTFNNLTHIELVSEYYIRDWREVVRFLKYCPKVQVLVINQPNVHHFELGVRNLGNWEDPPYVPKCILLHLKECYLNDYNGTKGEFEFTKYIMQNGRLLQRMTICNSTAVKPGGEVENLKKLSSCTRRSATCKLSFI